MQRIDINELDSTPVTYQMPPMGVAQAAPVYEAPVAQAAPVQAAHEEKDTIQIDPNLKIDESVHSEVQNEMSDMNIDGTEIASMVSAYYGGFTKMLGLLSPGLSSDDALIITKGELVMSKSGGIIVADLTKVFGQNNWHLKDPVNSLKALNLISGGEKVTILDTENEYIIYSSANGMQETVCNITKQEEKNYPKLDKIPEGDLLYTIELPVDLIDNLNTAKSVYNSMYFNISFDENTNELVSIDVNGKHTKNLINPKGRSLTRIKVRDLFPIKKPESIIIEIRKVKDDIVIKTISDILMTKIEFTTYATHNPKDAVNNFDLIM